MSKTNLRQISYQILQKVDKGFFHQELLNNLTGLESRDINFVRVLVKGVLKNRILISKFIGKYSSRNIDKIDSDVMIFLEIGFYQLIWMDSVPDYAALNETLEAMKKSGLYKAAGLVNAVLRAFIRDNKDILWTSSLSADVRYSIPAWLFKRIEKQYNPEFAEKIVESMNNEPDMTVFINTDRMDKQEIEDGLRAGGIEFKRSALFSDMLIIKGGGITATEPFKKGALYIQDQGSRLVAYITSKVAEGNILDAAAAPGGKTVNLIADGFNVFAADISPMKLIRLRENLERLQLKPLGLAAFNSLKKLPFTIEFDTILLDAPCSATGRIRRAPEIKYRLQPSDFNNLNDIQLKLLENLSDYVRNGGHLIYATCSLDSHENEDVVSEFLKGRQDYQVIPPSDIEGVEHLASMFSGDYIKTDTIRHGTDCFFIAVLKRVS